MKPLRAVISLTLSLLAGAALAQPAAPPAPAAPRGPPRLIVVISVDQFSADLFAQYRQHFTGGLRRLSNGMAFPSGYQAHAATETCPGHSTILTGSRPSRTGIIANNWYDLSLGREDKSVYCSEDPSVAGSSSTNYTVSPQYLRVPALGDHMKRADPASRVVAVAGKDRAAIMMGGRAVDQRWWWGGRDFTSQNQHRPTEAVTRANQAIAVSLARPAPALTLSPLCETRARAVPLGGGGPPVGSHRFARDAGDARSFRASPEMDGATLALAMALRDEMRLGQGRATDLLIVGLSATDYVGHAFGTQGAEMCQQLIELDRSLGDLFIRMDRTGVDYLVVLTADHGGVDIPERANANGGALAARVEPTLTAAEMGRAIGVALGLQGPVLIGDGAFGDIYVDRALAPAVRMRVVAEAARRYRAHPQVAAAFTRDELRAAPSPTGPPDTWSLIDRARASFDAERSGDLVVLLRPRITPISDTSRGYVSTHGSPWDYDRRVPILFWRRGMQPFEQPLAVETVDILPTLAAVIGLDIPAGTIDGRCLDLIEGPESSCAAR
ncbi:MAG TPA: alkaline phosphatase family protein [Allosphingosinicella sp.]|nr:alkaline phosphatase family protein [Allosphingosinicella sp.]